MRDLTGHDLRNGILAAAAAQAVISNDSGLMHIAAAIGTPTMGIFGPTDPYLWAPLNPITTMVQRKEPLSCQPCQRTVCTVNDHRCMKNLAASEIVAMTMNMLPAKSVSSP
jgi:heptosyltransferase-2